MARSGRFLLAWCVWFTAMFWLWMLLVGEWEHEEWIAAAAAAALGASFAEAARHTAEVRARPTLERLARVPSALLMVLVDFAVLVGLLAEALVRRRLVRGVFVHRRLSIDAPGLDPESVGRRALTILVAGYSPNAYVIDIDRRRRHVTLHDLRRMRRSEEPA
jgi:hypothetical protein